MNRTAVVILNWNGKALLEQFLPSVVRYTPAQLADIIVADNGSTDDSLPFLTANYPEVKTILLDKNYGFAEGYNQALDKLDHEYAVILNSDVEVTDGWLATAIAYLDQHPGVAGLQPKILSYRDKTSFEYAGAGGGMMDHLGYPFCRGRIFGTIEKDEGQYNKESEILWATGACLIVRLSEYKEAGGFDKNFFAHQEEIDLCWRLNARGKKLVCLPGSVVYHVGGATLEAEHPQKTYLNFRNNLLMLYKNLPKSRLRKVMFLRFWLDYLAGLQFLLAGKTKNAVSVRRARHDFHKLKKAYLPVREDNLKKAVQENIPGMYPKSLLWQYYAGGKKTYDRL